MTDALALCDAYIGREKGPPGRAVLRTVCDRLRHVEPALADTQRREIALLNEVGILQVELERAYAELAQVRDRSEGLAVQLEHRRRQARAARDAWKAEARHRQELEARLMLADERDAPCPPTGVPLWLMLCLLPLTFTAGLAFR